MVEGDEINPKLEYRNPKQIQMIRWEEMKRPACPIRMGLFETFEFGILELLWILN